MKSSVALKNRLSVHAKELEETLAKEIISNEFKKYVDRHSVSSTGPLAINQRGV